MFACDPESPASRPSLGQKLGCAFLADNASHVGSDHTGLVGVCAIILADEVEEARCGGAGVLCRVRLMRDRASVLRRVRLLLGGTSVLGRVRLMLGRTSMLGITVLLRGVYWILDWSRGGRNTITSSNESGRNTPEG